jgi:hypothetical protein
MVALWLLQKFKYVLNSEVINSSYVCIAQHAQEGVCLSLKCWLFFAFRIYAGSCRVNIVLSHLSNVTTTLINLTSNFSFLKNGITNSVEQRIFGETNSMLS